MDLINEIIARAKADRQRIVLPEGTEERTLKAADLVLADGVADIILLGNSEEIKKLAAEWGLKNIEKATIIDPANHAKKEQYAELLCELRKKKGMTIEDARKLVLDPLYLGCLIIKSNDADGQLAGAQNTTGDVLRPALQIIKTAPGMSVVSGSMLLITKAPEYGKDGLLVIADVAVLPNPTAEELAQIAVATGRTARMLANVEPKVAMLSFSTKGSAKHEMVDKVAEATRLAKELAPDMLIDGELQADAALVPSVGSSKAPGSAVAGQANTLVFPSLEVGNIAYKMVQRLGGAEAVGPILQGMAAPVNDLSRGCSIEDIYRMIAITANQAIGAKNNKKEFKGMAEMIKEPIENYGLSSKDRKKTLFSKIGIVGCGKEGSKIATVAATAGIEVVFLEISDEKIEAAFDRIAGELDMRIATWGLTETEKKTILGRISGTLTFDSLKDCDFVIEAVRYDENGERSLNHRKEIFLNLEAVLAEDAIIATNASSVVITELASELKHKERCVCLHFVIMQPQSRVMEIVRGLYTSDDCYKKVCQFAKLISYDYVTVEESAGLICNRMFFILLNEACAILQEGLTTPIEIDSIIKFGLGQRQGVFCMADQMGIEKIVPQMEDLYKEFGSLKYKPSPLLLRLNRAKHWGVRTGMGFYAYDKEGNRMINENEKK